MNPVRRRLATLAAAACVLVVVPACSSTNRSATPTTVTHPSTTTAHVATTVPRAPTTVVSAAPTMGLPSSAAAAAHLVAAWENHDRVAAAQSAYSVAVKGIFGTPDPAMWLRGCTDDDSLVEGGCIYLTETGAVQINTEKRSIGWVVTTANWG